MQDLILTGPTLPSALEALEASFKVHRMWEAADREAFLKAHGKTRFMAATYHAPAASFLAEAYSLFTAARLETDDVVPQQSLADLLAPRHRQEPPVVGIWPGDMHELLDDRLGPESTDHTGGQIEVVVLQHDDRLIR